MNYERQAVVTEALTFVGTPFIHQASVKGVGVDCARLVDLVYSSLGLIKPTEFPVYGQDWFRHTENENKYIVEGLIAAGFKEVPAPEIGGVVVVKIGKAYAHCGIIVAENRVLCAWPTKERVQVVNLKEDHIFRRREKRYFSLWA